MRDRIGAIFVAVSEDKGQDLEGQLRECRELCARLGLRVPDEFVFKVDGESRFRGNVPAEKKRLLDAARARKFDVVVAWSLDRWSRTRREGAREVFETLPSWGIRLACVQEPWLTTEGIPDGIREALGHIVLWIAEEDSNRKSKRVKLRYETNRNRASAGGGRARWGRGRVATLQERERVLQLRATLDARGRPTSVRAIARETSLPKSSVSDILAEVSERSGRDGASSSPAGA